MRWCLLPITQQPCPYLWDFQGKLQQHPNKVITSRSYKNFDDEKFTQDLSEAHWHVGEVFDDLEDHVYYWNTLMANINDENLPLKKMRVRAKDVPYMTTNWKHAIRAKRRALATYQNDKSDSNWDALHIWRNEATRHRRIAIKSYWKSKSDHLKEKPADFYRTFMPFLGLNARARSTEFNIKVGNEIVKNPDKVAETLANLFCFNCRWHRWR